MTQWQVIVAGIGIALISALGGYQLQQHLKKDDVLVSHQPEQKAVKAEDLIGTQVADFVLSDVNDAQRSLSEWQGKVIALNFWATWCPPCRDEIPHFVELQDHYGEQGLQFIGIALQHADEVRDFLDEFKVNYPSLVGGDDVIQIAKTLGNDIGALPYTVIIDRSGNISFIKRGPVSKEEAESVILSVL